MEDANRKRHTVKVDIPKFIEDKFIYIGGNKKVIKKQNFLYPVVKINSETVQIVTNYNKMTITRVGTKSISSIERLKKLLKTNDAMKGYFKFGSALNSNNKHITTIEYDELSIIAINYTNKKCKLYFDQNEAKALAEKNQIKIQKIIFLSVMIKMVKQFLFMKIPKKQKTVKRSWMFYTILGLMIYKQNMIKQKPQYV